ncbi:hypothetical protein ACP275_09G055300 [Erythranthe tilingii]
MESSNNQMNGTTKFEHETSASAYANLKAHPSPAIDKIAPHPKECKLNKSPSSSQSSSSPDSPLDDHFHNGNDNDDDDDVDTSASGNPSAKIEPPIKNASSSSSSATATAAAAAPTTTTTTTTTSTTTTTTTTTIEAPPNQEMERTDHGSYRIPPSVFETSPSSNAMDWSVASNESLFSIHTGNMSFTNDHIFWRSGELCTPVGDQVQTDHMFSYSAQQPSGGVGSDMRSRELGLAEATMKEVIKESECHNYEPSLASVRNCRRSQGSDASTRSFAFSLIGGETDKSASSVRMPSSVRSGQEQVESQPIMTKAESTKLDQPKTPTTTPNGAARSNWFSFFNCCSCGRS